jgi:hypothetical protein
VSLFSLLSFSQETEGSPAHKFAGGGRGNNGVDQASFKEVLPCREGSSGKETLPEKSKRQKAKLPKFEQSNFYFFKVIFLEHRALYGKPVRGGTKL